MDMTNSDHVRRNMNEIRKERKTGRMTGIRTLQVLFRIIYASRSGIPQKKKEPDP